MKYDLKGDFVMYIADEKDMTRWFTTAAATVV